MSIAQGYKVNVTRHFADGGSSTVEMVVFDYTNQSSAVVENNARDHFSAVFSYPTSTEARRITSVDFTYIDIA